MSVVATEFLTLSKQVFETYIIEEYPNVLQEMTEVAELRDQKIRQAKKLAKEEMLKILE